MFPFLYPKLPVQHLRPLALYRFLASPRKETAAPSFYEKKAGVPCLHNKKQRKDQEREQGTESQKSNLCSKCLSSLTNSPKTKADAPSKGEKQAQAASNGAKEANAASNGAKEVNAANEMKEAASVSNSEEIRSSTLKTQFLTQTVRIFNREETLSRQKLDTLEKLVNQLRNDLSSFQQQNLELIKRVQQLESKSKLPVLSVNEETYFAPPLPLLKELRTDEQGQLRLMTPPPSATSVSSIPSPKAFSL